MIYSLEIQDDDLEYVNKKYCGRFSVNRYLDEEFKVIQRLIDFGIVRQVFRDDAEGCYHPTHEVTDLGEKVLNQFKEMKNNGS